MPLGARDNGVMPSSHSRSRGPIRRYPRTARVDRVIQEIVADALERIDDERLNLVTVTGVKADPDLRQAIVFYAARGDVTEEIVDALEDERVALQHAIGRQVRMKFTPHLRFIPDPAIETGWKIEAILKDLPPARSDDESDREPDA